MTEPTPHPVDALLLMAPGCSHCPVVMEGLTRLIKEGRLARLEIVNIQQAPETASELGVRSVPWCRIGPFELEGEQGFGELSRWAGHAAAGTGLTEYYAHLLEHRRSHRVEEMIRQQPETLSDLILLLSSLDTPLVVRIGVGAVLEELAERGELRPAVDELAALTRSDEPQIRADAAHYLSLTGDRAAIDPLRRLLDDPDAEVREIAAESLAVLETGAGHERETTRQGT
ncbi:MAG TPA: HEAT repeat domain-containing protein [Sedimenticola thiotaurini]|uniref:HEAT repeat domain-containing protein n=1 Tax=Sedimenticola thiotaurini TaxID=1543721 RepID=A0A831RM21_9GAMM|nr:HEAT repeat domain-containing protein [Sedimenticola thiotaurini]